MLRTPDPESSSSTLASPEGTRLPETGAAESLQRIARLAPVTLRASLGLVLLGGPEPRLVAASTELAWTERDALTNAIAPLCRHALESRAPAAGKRSEIEPVPLPSGAGFIGALLAVPFFAAGEP